MKKLISFWQECTQFEKLWCLTFTLVSVVVGFIQKVNGLNILASILGLWCVFLVAKGKMTNFLVGAVYLLVDAYLHFQYGLYFMTGLSLFFYLPLQWIGWKIWSAHPPLYAMNHEQVSVRQMFPRGWLAIFIALIVIVLMHVQALHMYYQNHNTPWESLVITLAITGQLLMTGRFVEQWVAWIGINLLSCVLWLMVFLPNDQAVWSFVSMWLLNTINAIYGWHNWKSIQDKQATMIVGAYCEYEPQMMRRY